MIQRMTITRGRPYEALINIKQPNSPTSAILPDGATADFSIISKKDGALLLTSSMVRDFGTGTPAAPVDTVFKLTLTDVETATLPFEIGYPEDGGEFIDTCRGHIAVKSVASPDIQNADVFIPKIYVADIGLV